MVLFAERVHRHQVRADDGAAVGVGAEEGHLSGRQFQGLFDARLDEDGGFAVDPDEVERDGEDLVSFTVIQEEGFGPEVGFLPFGDVVAAAVAGHPHRLFGRDDGLGDPGFPAGFGGEKPIDRRARAGASQERKLRCIPRSGSTMERALCGRS